MNITATEIEKREKQCSKEFMERYNQRWEPLLDWTLKFLKDYERKHKIKKL